MCFQHRADLSCLYSLDMAGTTNNGVDPVVTGTTSTSEIDNTDNHAGTDTSTANPNGYPALGSTGARNTSEITSTKTGATAGNHKPGSGQGQSTSGHVPSQHSHSGYTSHGHGREEKEKENTKERETNEDGAGTGDGSNKNKFRRNAAKRLTGY